MKGFIILCTVIVRIKSAAIDEYKPVHCAHFESIVDNPVQTHLDNPKGNDLVKSEQVYEKSNDKGNGSVLCNRGIQHCYVLWKFDAANASHIIVLKKGCWDYPDMGECMTQECVSTAYINGVQHLSNTRFCCCHGDMCNRNVMDNMQNVQLSASTRRSVAAVMALEPEVVTIDLYYRERTIVIALSSVTSVAVAIIVVYYLYRKFSEPKCDAADEIAFLEASSSHSTSGGDCLDISDLKLDFMLTSGRFGEVWHGTLGRTAVVVKVFVPEMKQYYDNEKSIYSLSMFENDTILKFIGAGQCTKPSGVQYCLILSYMPLGSLLDYLRRNTVNFFTFHRMCQSIAAAVSYIHSERSVGDWLKPAVVHRDLNSRNILVRENLSCCLCDFGVSMQIKGNRIIVNNEELEAKKMRLTDVGTVRYMPPEVLDCVVDMFNCESALKQVDMYAVGLVMWEISMRCTDFFLEVSPPDYCLPYEAEIGLKPSLEQMKLLICHHRKRPQFPDVWNDQNEAIQLFKMTVEECWDEEAEARLAAPCLVERLDCILELWNINKGNQWYIKNMTNGKGALGKQKGVTTLVVDCDVNKELVPAWYYEKNDTASESEVTLTENQNIKNTACSKIIQISPSYEFDHLGESDQNSNEEKEELLKKYFLHERVMKVVQKQKSDVILSAKMAGNDTYLKSIARRGISDFQPLVAIVSDELKSQAYGNSSCVVGNLDKSFQHSVGYVEKTVLTEVKIVNDQAVVNAMASDVPAVDEGYGTATRSRSRSSSCSEVRIKKGNKERSGAKRPDSLHVHGGHGYKKIVYI